MGWPFRVRKGSLQVTLDSISWQDIKGSVGDHLVHGADGKLSWKDKTFIDAKSLQASLDSNQLLQDLGKIETISDKVTKVVSEAEGQIIIKSGKFSGPLKSPDSWQYDLEIFTSGSRWTSSLLPQTILTESARVVLTEGSIDLSDGKFWLQEQPLLLSGTFDHELFGNWQGEIIASGTIRNSVADWIREKGWIPENYFPRIPCTLDKLKVTWTAGNVLLNGTIGAGMGGLASPSVRFSMEADKEFFEIEELVVVSPEEQGKLGLKYLKKDGGELDVNWQGFIDSVTIESLLENNISNAERIEGDFNFKYPIPEGNKGFSGWVKINDLGWIFNLQRKDIIIPELKLVGGKDGAITLEQSSVDINGDRLEIIGTMGLDPGVLSFNIYLDGDRLKAGTFTNIIEDFGNLDTGNKEHGEGKGAAKNQVKGTIHFQVDSVESGNDHIKNVESIPSGQPHISYAISPAKGFVTVDSLAGHYSIDLRDSKVCGLDISGIFNSKTSEYESSLNIFTDSSSPPLFKDILPCFGFRNALIDGDMHLDVNFKGRANKWLSGKANLFSNQGYIHRLGFLSKAFRLVNLRDIFTQDMPDFANKGFAYSKLDITSHIEANKLKVEKAVVDGEGLNLFGHGTIELDDWSADLTMMMAPLKTVDAVLTKIPLLGKVIGGQDKAVISIPIGLRGDLRDPDVVPLPPGAIGQGLINLIGNTLMMPFQIFSPGVQENQ
jgi:hypothetical protein